MQFKPQSATTRLVPLAVWTVLVPYESPAKLADGEELGPQVWPLAHPATKSSRDETNL